MSLETKIRAKLADHGTTPETLFAGHGGRFEIISETVFEGSPKTPSASTNVRGADGVERSVTVDLDFTGGRMAPAEYASGVLDLPNAPTGHTAILVEAILSFDEGPQEFLTVGVVVPDEPMDLERMKAFETEVAATIIGAAFSDMSDLMKISTCYLTDTGTSSGIHALIRFVTRCDGKYYFQPNQRDDHEQAIVDRTGVASRTAPFVARRTA